MNAAVVLSVERPRADPFINCRPLFFKSGEVGGKDGLCRDANPADADANALD